MGTGTFDTCTLEDTEFPETSHSSLQLYLSRDRGLISVPHRPPSLGFSSHCHFHLRSQSTRRLTLPPPSPVLSPYGVGDLRLFHTLPKKTPRGSSFRRDECGTKIGSPWVTSVDWRSCHHLKTTKTTSKLSFDCLSPSSFSPSRLGTFT